MLFPSFLFHTQLPPQSLLTSKQALAAGLKAQAAELRRFDAPEDFHLESAELVLSNYGYNFIIENGFTARPYELRVYRLGIGNEA